MFHRFTIRSLRPVLKYNKRLTISGLTLSSSVIIYHLNNTKIRNDILKPDQNGVTYENSLFISSQKELIEEEAQLRRQRINSTFGVVYRIKYLLKDYIWEPLLTIGRFLELSVIFLPCIISYPLTWFGNSRSFGNLLWYKILRIALENAGASFIKLGQWAGSRTDLFSQELCDELGNLHSNAKQHSIGYTKEILSQSFGGLPFDEIFESFNEKPIGVGAIAQVYLATLSKRLIDEIDDVSFIKSKRHWFFNKISNDPKPSPNQVVAIKVMHPNVVHTIKRDLNIMRFFANCINYIPTMEWVALPDEVRNFDILMNLQLDLRIEGLNLKKFQENYKDDFLINFPKPFLKFSNRFILVEEFINGISMSKLLELKVNNQLNDDVSKKLSDKIIDSFLQMLILNNFIHSDLHPGNIFVRFVKLNEFQNEVISSSNEKDQISTNLKNKTNEDLAKELIRLNQNGYYPEVCYIDAGLVTELDERNRVNFIALFNSLAEFDGYKAGELMIERSKTPETAVDPEIFALKVERLVDKIKQRTFTLGTVSIGDLLEKMLTMVRSHHVRMEGDFVSVVVAILLLEGIGRQLDPELDLFARCVYFTLINGIPE
ncbi:hypothetical protein WICMUC_004079 [Wickerhamomyces mucosus]|uniref:Protein kinase domain-containing protein n=1 Tax=Wickerhamomyces mucosus TaxID=1378264 RepID=A0A9P8PIS8_9ASCO|nr:hypothetical protein WICMUC_004079 [Wickerhamomyces mucosus]